jgi:DNA repair exonuclease SbcCD ATPase subunit
VRAGTPCGAAAPGAGCRVDQQLQAGAGHPTGTGGGGDPVARAAELEERLRSLQMFGAMNVPGAALPEPGATGFEALRTGPSEAESMDEMEREREDLEDALGEAEQVAAAAVEESTRLEDEKAALLEEKARLEEQLDQAEAKAAEFEAKAAEVCVQVPADAEETSGSGVATMKAQLTKYKEEMRVLNRYLSIRCIGPPAALFLLA